MNNYPKRLIEVDLPIARISAHARREKSIRHGHISTLHIWWARRPLAACRAVICASLWPDPEDLTAWLKEAEAGGAKGESGPEIRAPRDCKPGEGVTIRPRRFLDEARKRMTNWAQRHMKKASAESMPRQVAIQKDPAVLNDPAELRRVLLDFIADFANWDNSTDLAFLETSRALTQAAHEALGGEPGSRPLVVDPFAGGGALPLEAARCGAEAFASDLNPLAVLLNRITLEFAPRYGAELPRLVEEAGDWLRARLRDQLCEFYPCDPDGSEPIGYLWARTIKCEGPSCGVSVPIVRSCLISDKRNREIGVLFEYDGDSLISKLVSGQQARQHSHGTSRRSAVTCPKCGYTTARSRVEVQANESGFGFVLYALCLRTPTGERFYREPLPGDLSVLNSVDKQLTKWADRRYGDIESIPREELPYLRSIFNVRVYGIDRWNKLFHRRQLLSTLITVRAVRDAARHLEETVSDPDLRDAVLQCLALSVSNSLQYQCSIATYLTEGVKSAFIQGQSLPMKMDFIEANPLMDDLAGGYAYSLRQHLSGLSYLTSFSCLSGVAQQASATDTVLPADSVDVMATDPPYYDVVPYADCADFFYVWLRRMLRGNSSFATDDPLVPKKHEIVQLAERNRRYREKTKGWFEAQLRDAFERARDAAKPSSIGVIVFAHKETSAWEALLQSVLDAGWVVTSSWPIDTEKATRLRANKSAVLGSSVHLVCRPRENPDGSVQTDEVGDWRDVLSELPERMHLWMPRLGAEGVVGADAIFACLGPALEIFSRYSRVEKASGEVVTLGEYLEQVWAAVSKEALSMLFADADASALEPDARLTAMWLWTLGAGNGDRGSGNGKGTKARRHEGTEGEEDDAESNGGKAKTRGYVLEYDAARKIAQGLGAHLDRLQSVVEVKGDKARLLTVAERTKYLFGKDAEADQPRGRRRKKTPQLSLFAELEAAEEAAGGGWGGVSGASLGSTALDRVHQAMILFAAGRGEALRRFLVEDGAGADARFWKLAQSLSALYPAGSDEKRWVDGVLGRKKGLGL